MSGHFINQCKHGTVTLQCQCLNQKRIITVVPCPPTCVGSAPRKKPPPEAALEKLVSHLEEELKFAEADLETSRREADRANG